MRAPFSGVRAPEDVVDLLMACHERIRTFLALARKLGEAAPDEVPTDQVRAGAERVRRYFEEALPLHAADEDETLTPLLRGRDPVVDAALARMQAEHLAHREALTALVALCRELEGAPGRHAERRSALAELATRLQVALHAHLASEEATVLPAVRALLTDAERAQALVELRARRQR